MKKIEITVINKGFGFSIGETANYKKVCVKNGDLKTENKIIVIVSDEDDRFINAEIEETLQNEKVIKKFEDTDGLIKSNLIEKFVSDIVIEIENKWIFPNRLIQNVINYIRSYPDLLQISKFSFTGNRISSSRVTSFGLTFQQALRKLNKQGIERARLYCEKKQDFTDEGVVAEMLVNTTKNKDGTVSIEAWQGIKEENEVFYLHGIMNSKTEFFIHFDGAIIGFSIEDKKQLFRENKKIKGGTYKKLFRLDGEISSSHVFEIANKFFPLDKLIDEYFEIERIT